MQMNPGALTLLLVLSGFSAHAQEAGTEFTEAQARAAEIEGLEPGVRAEDLSADSAAPGGRLAVAATPVAATMVAAQEVRRRVATNGVMDEIDLRRTEITGNQELPRVLYIVPWQKSDPGDLIGKPINTLLDEVLAPIDRLEFLRQVQYYGDLYKAADE